MPARMEMMDRCPDETELADLVEGHLAGARRAEILAHVERCALCQQVVGAGVGGEITQIIPRGQTVLPPGTQVSRYVLQAPLGSGAMGIVYAAHDPELNREVAVKLLRPEGQSVDELRRRMLLEAQSLAKLSHANVVTVYDVGVCGDGVFIAMELIHGETLAQWMGTPRPWREVLEVLLSAARGLGAAHAAGLIHRDFKPENVLVGEEDGRVRVTDFGLVRAADAEETAGRLRFHTPISQQITQAGMLVGTPAYMAPEVLEGEPATERSDQFSFCVALHEALYGVRPFQGRSLAALSEAAREGVLPPPARGARVPGWVRRAVGRGLRADPEERFASMEQLIRALRPPTERKRYRLAGAAVALGLLAGTGWTLLAADRHLRCAREVDRLSSVWTEARRDRIRAAFERSRSPIARMAWEKVGPALDAYAEEWRMRRTDACLSPPVDSEHASWMVSGCLDARLSQLSGLTDALEQADARVVLNAQLLTSLLPSLADCGGLTLRPQPPPEAQSRVEAAQSRLRAAQVQVSSGRYEAALTTTSELLLSLPEIDFRPHHAEVLLVHATALAKLGKAQEAEEALHRAVFAAEAGRDDELAARAWIALVSVVHALPGRTADWERVVSHAEAWLERLEVERFPSLGVEFHYARGVALFEQDRLAPAAEALSKGLELARRSPGPQNLQVSQLLHQLGRLRIRQGRMEESLKLSEESLALAEGVLGPEHPDLAATLNSVASVRDWLNQPAEAIAAWQRAISLHEKAGAPEHVSLALPLYNSAEALRVQGRLEEAKQAVDRAYRIFERIHGPDHPKTAMALARAARVEQDLGNLDSATQRVNDALARMRRSAGPQAPQLATLLRHRSHIEVARGRLAQGRRDLLEGLRIIEQGNTVDSYLSIWLRALGQLELKAGQPAEALRHCERAAQLDTKLQDRSGEVARDLTCVGEAQLALGHARAAVATLQQARDIAGQQPRDVLEAARNSFLLARALSAPTPMRDQSQARNLVAEAKARLQSLGTSGRPELAKVLAWQRGTALQ